MIFGLTVVVVTFWLAVFLVFFGAEGRSLPDYLRGKESGPPVPYDEWRQYEVPGAEANEVFEERYLPDPGGSRRGVTRQRRVRDRATGAVLRVLEDRRMSGRGR